MPIKLVPAISSQFLCLSLLARIPKPSCSFQSQYQRGHNIRESEILQEAGFRSLELIRSATLFGAQSPGAAEEIGSVEQGKLVNLANVSENPLKNLQVLYGIGAIQLTKDDKVLRVDRVKCTIRDGILYDAKNLLADVAVGACL